MVHSLLFRAGAKSPSDEFYQVPKEVEKLDEMFLLQIVTRKYQGFVASFAIFACRSFGNNLF